METLTFQQEIHLEHINLARAALRFSQEIGYPGLAIERYLQRLDDLADAARLSMPFQESPVQQGVSLARYLFQESGFQGNSQKYNDPRNSYLNEVLDRKLGLPISLSVIFLAVAERLGLPADGIGLPGHLIVGVPGPDGPLFLDPFHGGQQLSVIDCARLVELSTGYTGQFLSEWLQPVDSWVILTRMLYNLRNVYIQQDKWRMALPVVEHMLFLQPEHPDHLRDLGTIHRQNGELRQAIIYYERYLNKVPDATDADLVQRNLQETAKVLASLN